MADVEISDRALTRECSVLSRYLVGLEPDTYLVEKYVLFERGRASAEALEATGCFDRGCLRLLRLGAFGARLVDSYTSRFRRGGPAFRKLVAMLALLECRPASSDRLAQPYSGGPAQVIARLTARGIGDALTLMLSLALLGPVHLLQRAGVAELRQ